MQPDYDFIAPVYDSLAQLTFGKAIIHAQIFLVKKIPTGSRILIAGGGTGWILEEITRIHPQGLQITYVELSQKMINHSRKRYIGQNEVVFIHQSLQEADINSIYDVIITPFFLDNFLPSTATIVFNKLHHHLCSKGLWLFADFQIIKNSRWQKLIVKTMYFFFRTICHIEATHLPDMPQLFLQYGYKQIEEKTFYKQFITAVVYRKEGPVGKMIC